MKKLFTLFALLGAIFFAQQASAASYNLKIAGTTVTDANKSNLTGLTSNGSISGGTITFNSSTNVLTIPAGVTIAAEGAHGIEIGSMNITIKIGSGTVTITSNKRAIQMNNEGSYTCTLEGNNTSTNNTVSYLKLTGGDTGSACFHINKNNTGIVNNLYVFTSRSKGAKFGIDGPSGGGGTLIVKGNSLLQLNGGTSAIGDLNTLTLQDNHEFNNSNSAYAAYFKSGSGNNTFSASESVADYAEITKASTVYSLYICGFHLNNLNAKNIGVKLKAAGYLTSASNTVTFNASSSKISFQNATIKYAGNIVRNEGISGLTMEFGGTNNLTSNSSGGYGFNLWANTTLTGTGTLNLTSSGRGVAVSGSSIVTFSGGLTATIKGTDAVRGYYNNSETDNPDHKTQNNRVVFNNVSVTMTATSGDVCSTFGGGIEVTNCDVVTAGMHVHGPASYSNGRPGYGIGKVSSSGGWNAATNTTVVIRNNPTTTYPVAIGNRRINSNNYQNITWPGISGTVTYTPTTSTLTLNDATISPTDSDYGINVYNGFSTLLLIGTNKISSKYTCFELNESGTTCSIYGAGSLELNSTSGCGIRLYSGDESLTVNCASLTANGSTYGFYGNGSNAKLTLTKYSSGNSSYYFNGPGSGSMAGIASLTFNTMDFDPTMSSSTEGAYFDDASKSVKLITGEVAKGTIKFRNPSTYYNIKIAGKQLNDCNRDGFGSKYITASKKRAVIYNATDNILTLDGATISNGTTVGNTHGAGNPIDCWIPNLTIKTTSASTINSSDNYYYPLFVGANTTITGNEKLTIKGHSSTIRVYNSPTITFKDANVSISGSINTTNNTTKFGGVVVDNSTVSIGNQIYNANSVTWKNGTALLKPQGGSYDATAGYMKLANGNEAYGIEFGKSVSYGLKIDKIAVTNANNTDPTGDGSFSYDPTTKTLTVKKSYTGKNNSVIISNPSDSGVEDLVINFTGGYTLMSPNNSCIQTYKNTTIKSSSSSSTITLMNNSESGDGIGEYGKGKTLTLDNVKMVITAPYGIYSNTDANNKLVIKKCELTVTSTKGYKCIGNFTSGVELSECGIYSPQGGKFSSGGTAVDKSGTTITTSLIINQQGTGIEAVVADDFDGTEVEGVDNAEGIYDLNGRRLNELQRGVNIVRRRDGSTVKVVKK